MNLRTFISIILTVWCTGYIGGLSCDHDSTEDTVAIASLVELQNSLQSDDGCLMAAAETLSYQCPVQSAKRGGGQKWSSLHYSHINIVQSRDEVSARKMVQSAPWKTSSHHSLIFIGKLLI